MSAPAPSPAETTSAPEHAPTLIEVDGLERFYPIRKGITDLASARLST